MTKATEAALKRALTKRAQQSTKFHKGEIDKTRKAQTAAQEAINAYTRTNDLGTARVKSHEERAISHVEKALGRQTERHNAKLDDLAYTIYEQLQQGKPEEKADEEEKEDKDDSKPEASELKWSSFRWLKSPGILKFAKKHNVEIPGEVVGNGNKAMKAFVRQQLNF